MPIPAVATLATNAILEVSKTETRRLSTQHGRNTKRRVIDETRIRKGSARMTGKKIIRNSKFKSVNRFATTDGSTFLRKVSIFMLLYSCPVYSPRSSVAIPPTPTDARNRDSNLFSRSSKRPRLDLRARDRTRTVRHSSDSSASFLTGKQHSASNRRPFSSLSSPSVTDDRRDATSSSEGGSRVRSARNRGNSSRLLRAALAIRDHETKQRTRSEERGIN